MCDRGCLRERDSNTDVTTGVCGRERDTDTGMQGVRGGGKCVAPHVNSGVCVGCVWGVCGEVVVAMVARNLHS